MKKWLIPLIIILVVGIGIYQWAVGFNNTAVEYEANAKWLKRFREPLILSAVL
jgi:LemA protein